jgi:hypothetical protein
VSAQQRNFAKFSGKARAARVFFYFKTARLPVSMPHALGRTPNAWRVVNISTDGVPGVVFAPINYSVAGTTAQTSDQFNLGRNAIVLACATANTWAEVEIT